MPEKIVITVDSTSDIPKSFLDRYQIEVIPLVIIRDELTYTDGVDIFPQDLFIHYNETGRLCKTSAPAVGDYQAMFEKWTRQRYSVIHLSISTHLSASYSSAMLAAEDFENVYVLDSMNLSSGIALLAFQACELRENGLSAAEIYELLSAQRGNVRSSFVLDTLEFLWKGGRCSALSALGANLLKLKPCIAVKNGKLDLEKKFRGRLDAVIPEYIDYILTSQTQPLDLSRIFITSTVGYDPEILDTTKKKLVDEYGFEETVSCTAGSTISCHCGPGTMGVLFFVKD